MALMIAFHVLCCHVSYYFRAMFGLSLVLFVRSSCFIYIICIYLLILVSNIIPHQIIYVLFNSNMTGVTDGAGTSYTSGAFEFSHGL